VSGLYFIRAGVRLRAQASDEGIAARSDVSQKSIDETILVRWVEWPHGVEQLARDRAPQSERGRACPRLNPLRLAAVACGRWLRSAGRTLAAARCYGVAESTGNRQSRSCARARCATGAR
jgi:hypothetical protein